MPQCGGLTKANPHLTGWRPWTRRTATSNSRTAATGRTLGAITIEMSESENIVNIDKLSLFIKKYSELISLEISSLSKINRKTDLLGFCNYIFLKRFYYNSLGIRSLLPLLKKDLYYKIPIGIIIRTCISDVLTYYYFVYLAREKADENEFNNELKAYLADNLHFLERHLDDEKAKRKISKEQYSQLRSAFLELYQDFLQPDSDKLLTEKHINFKKISILLKSKPELAWVADVYEFYDYLSKYEHFGVLTFDVQEVHTEKPLYDVKGYIICIGSVYEAVLSIIKTYKLDKKHKQRISFIRNILFTKKTDLEVSIVTAPNEPVAAMRVPNERQPSPYRLAHVDKKNDNM